jgi:hypothetical protein
MDLESSSFSTADYSFHQDPPDNNEYNFNNISPNFNENYSYYYPSTIDFTDTAYDTERSLYKYAGDRAGGDYFTLQLRKLFWTNSSSIEIEFDEGVSPPCEDFPTEFICAESYPRLSSVGSFDLRDTVL